MNTQTPAQALGEVLRLSESATPGKWAWNNDDQMWNDDDAIIIETDSGYYPPRKYDRALIAAAVNLIRQHGQHFAGLEEKLDVAMLAVKALQQDLHDQRWQHAQELKRAEAAEARCAELEAENATLERHLANAMAEVHRSDNTIRAMANEITQLKLSEAITYDDDVEAMQIMKEMQSRISAAEDILLEAQVSITSQATAKRIAAFLAARD